MDKNTGPITPEMIREAEGHLPLDLPKNDAYQRWQAMADFLNRAIENPNEPCPCCNVTPAGDVLDHLPSPPSASCEGSELPALERYGIEWRGPHMPVALPMPDGYWTPWHIAEAALKEREHERRPIADWERQSMEFLAKKLHERGDELSEDSASWLEKFALESALPRGLREIVP